MKKYFVHLSIICLFIVLLSCNKNKYRNTQTFSMSDIQEKIQLKGEIINNDEIIMPSHLFLKDSLLFTLNMRQSHHVSVFHIKDMKRIGDFIDFGGGPNEAVYVNDLQFQDSLVWVIDQSSRKANNYHLNQFLNANEVAVPHETIKIEETFNKLLILKDRLITNSLVFFNSRFTFYDRQGNFIENKGDLPYTGDQMTDLEIYESYSCHMVLNPGDESIFVAYVHTDLIEIYDSNGNLKTRRHGPDKFFPMKKEITDGDTRRVAGIRGKAKDAYIYPVVFEDEIWTLYRGGRSIVDGFLSNRIIVFDWDGNPIRHYTTDIDFYTLAVDRKNSVFYGITLSPDYAFVKFKY